jgi:hypothetical protein
MLKVEIRRIMVANQPEQKKFEDSFSMDKS